jgi:hypothetical protein
MRFAPQQSRIRASHADGRTFTTTVGLAVAQAIRAGLRVAQIGYFGSQIENSSRFGLPVAHMIHHSIDNTPSINGSMFT